MLCIKSMVYGTENGNARTSPGVSFTDIKKMIMHLSCDSCSAKLEDEMGFNIILLLSLLNGYSELTVLQQTFYQI